MTLKEIKQILQERQLHPLKRFGQNFLFDQNLCQWIIKEAIIKPEETVWEIGPGLGALTEWILPLAKEVKVIEIDRGFISYLNEKWGNLEKFQLHAGDALELVPKLIPSNTTCVIGNLPYSITTPLLVAFLEKDLPPERLIFTLQQEVGERLIAKPQSRNYGAVSVMIETVYETKLLRKLPPAVFYPQPEVFSVVISLMRRPTVKPLAWRKHFYLWLRQIFNQKRKQLFSLLVRQHPTKDWVSFFEKEKWRKTIRAEELDVSQWIKLFQYYSQFE